LLERGNRVAQVPVVRAVAETLAAGDLDLVVIDRTNADFNVQRLCGDLARSLDVPIVVYSPDAVARDEQWCTDLLRMGATSVVVDDPGRTLLVAQVDALARLRPRRRERSAKIVVGDVVVDVAGRELVVAGRAMPCPLLQLRLLTALAAAPNEVVTNQNLLADVWGLEPSSHPHRVRIAVSQLRRRLGEAPRRPRIETVSTLGYRLVVPA